MILTFELSAGMDMEMTLAIDTSVVLPEYAHNVVSFRASSKQVLAASGDDDYQALARYAAPSLWLYLLDGYNEAGAVEELLEQEGWGWPGGGGLRIVGHELPCLSAASLQVEVLS